MKSFFITSDSYWETKIEKVVEEINKSNLKGIIESNNYGDDIEELIIVLMCRLPNINFEQRIKYSRKNKTLSIDLMLNFKEMMELDYSKKVVIVANKIQSEVPIIISKYKFAHFNVNALSQDLEIWKEKLLDHIN